MKSKRKSVQNFLFSGVLLLLCSFIYADAEAFTLNVVGPDGAPVSGYRWLLEEDLTYQSVPEVKDPQTHAVTFHRSYMPPVMKGETAGETAVITPEDTSKNYYVSVLPNAGYSLGGAKIKPGQDSVTVTVNTNEVPTARIAIFIFNDNQPVNNAPDLPQEQGLGDFQIILEDAAGRYGMAGGQVFMDAYGNPIGTTYNADGSVNVIGPGYVKSGPDGRVIIENIPPGKYGVRAVPPVGSEWVQTTTIEGSKTIDAWVKANEPKYFTEFGPPGVHVFIGFIEPFVDERVLSGGSTITGQVVNLHNSRPPEVTFYNGAPHDFTTAWIGLNDVSVGDGKAVYAREANADGTFSIDNVPPGDYQLVVWDKYLDIVIALYSLTVPAGGEPVVLGDVPVFSWFARLESTVFYDRNANGFRDCVTEECNDTLTDDYGIPEVAVNLRFRDGTLYKSFATDLDGYVPFDQIFPFFSWLVAEVDFGRLKATGATQIVDNGGPVSPNEGWDNPSRNVLTPQPQFYTDEAGNEVPLINPNTGNNLSSTETGPVLTKAFQAFLGQTNVIEWGKTDYAPGENGGISGMVYYATTRAEDNPAYAAAEEWEPGIPRVQVSLYADGDSDNLPLGWNTGTLAKGAEDLDWDGDGVFDAPNGQIADLDGDGVATLADVDNFPFGWMEGTSAKGSEDLDRDGDGIFDFGDAIQITRTDSWDDSLPTDCQGESFVHHGHETDCFDGIRNFNQVRPGVFDGGYAFDTYFPGGMGSGSAEVDGLVSGTYVVEASAPPAYELVKEEDKNVDFGDTPSPTLELLPPDCVNYDENGGSGHLVPAELVLFPGVAAPYAGEYRPLCDRKKITLLEGRNAAVEFFFYTEVPISGHLTGFILDDTANEFDPTSPQFGEKFSPPWLPVSIRDWTGREISRVYSDERGSFNALVPSTYTMNMASPSGVSPNMLLTCMNDPGPIEDPANPGSFITDPQFNRQYSQFCYTFQYMPGTTTYLDTPVVPVAAFAGPDQFPLDCEYEAGVPKIYSVSGVGGSGPYVPGPGSQITIISEGDVFVPNPLYSGAEGAEPKTISRDYGFGTDPGTVMLGTVPLTIDSWSAGSIVATVPAGAATGQLTVTRSNGNSSEVGVTVTVGLAPGQSIVPVSPGGSIQQAVDAASPGDIIMVAPGTYQETVIMWKPLQLQGWGSASTVINAANIPGESLTTWLKRIDGLHAAGEFDLLGGQELINGGLEPAALIGEQGAGVLILGKDPSVDPNAPGLFGPDNNARVDGLRISGSPQGGGIVLNGFNPYTQLSNNRLINNHAFYAGGIRVGHPSVVEDLKRKVDYADAHNDYVKIHNNHITQNGSLGGFGGGVGVHTGSDYYEVRENFICGNFTKGGGGGVGHDGLSHHGKISDNVIAFNQSFNPTGTPSGGGIYVGGGAPVGKSPLSPGSGSVIIDSNLIQGNIAGAGDGGGIRLNAVNGHDIARYKRKPGRWYKVDVLNNTIVNNIAGLSGGGISIQDSAKVNILHTTVVNNESTATSGLAFNPGSPNQSTPRVGGIVSHAHSPTLAATFGRALRIQRFAEFSNAKIINSIIWQNRSFYFLIDDMGTEVKVGLIPDVESGETPVYWDLWVEGTASPAYLDPRSSILTDTTGYDISNISSDPLFVDDYTNGARYKVKEIEQRSAIQVQPAFDEGGNFIDVRFGPLAVVGDYYLSPGSPAIDAAAKLRIRSYQDLEDDIDGDVRPTVAGQIDIGADEAN